MRLGEVEPVFGQTGRVVLDISRPLRDRPDEAQRRAVASPRAQAPSTRSGNASDGLKAKHSRVASHYQITVTANEAGDQAVAVNWTPPPPGRLDGYPSGRLLPAQQRDRLERRRLVAYLHHAHPTSRRYSARSNPSSACARSTNRKPGAGRRPPVHHRHRLPARAGHPHSAARAPRTRQVDHATPRPSKASSASPPPSAVPTDARCMCARQPKPNPDQRAIYDALGVDPHPGGVRKTLV